MECLTNKFTDTKIYIAGMNNENYKTQKYIKL